MQETHRPSIEDAADAQTALDLVFQDDTCLVLNKPPGLLSVPGKGPLGADCLAHRAQQVFPQALVVHRLDMATSGLILMANGPDWQRTYSKLFADRKIDKRYVAIVDGLVSNDEGEIDLPLIADWPNRPKQRVDTVQGKPSRTRYCVLERYTNNRTHNHNGTTRVLLEPITGRSHQLRVHMLAIGHPIVGDALYAPDRVAAATPRLMLHAKELRLVHPLTGELACWRSEVPF